MKKYIIFPILCIAMGFCPIETPIERVQTQYLSDCDAFETTLFSFKKTLTNESDKALLQAEFKKVRCSYKKISWLLTYLDPEAEKNINGAPIPRTEPIHFQEIAPKGLQVIETLIFDDKVALDKKTCLNLLQEVAFFARNWHHRMRQERLSDRQIFEAIRLELVSLYTLTLTGFDTPFSGNALSESQVIWATLQTQWECYHKAIKRRSAPLLVDTIEQLWTNGRTFLSENTDFNNLDRIQFYKQYWQPLYEKLLSAQLELEIETYEITGGFRRAWTDVATSLFDKRLLDPKFYADIRDKSFKDTPERIELGKKLFLDTLLSGNQQRSCGTCHQAALGFSDAQPKALGLDGAALKRNTMSLNYAAYASSQFWDGRARSMEEQFAHVLVNPLEMGSSMETLPLRLSASKSYGLGFAQAFPKDDAPIRMQNIQKAIGAYLRSLGQFDSDFDRFMRGDTSAISVEVQKGFNIFMGKGKCGTCHFAPVFNGTQPPHYWETEFEVLGVPNAQQVLDEDRGRYESYPAAKNKYAFKTVSIRNVARTAPYMHNGRYTHLLELVEFYDKGGGIGHGLSVSNQTLPMEPLGLTLQEKQNLIQFMESLTDKASGTAQ